MNNKKNLIWGAVSLIIILVIIYASKNYTPKESSAPADNKTPDTAQVNEETPKAPEETSSTKNPAPATKTPVPYQNIAPAIPSINNGRVIFAIKDKAANVDDIRSIFLTTASVKIHHPTKGWITIPNSAKEFDLLEIKKSGLLGILGDAYLEADLYNQLWLTITKVSILKLDGTTLTVKLPSQNIRFPAFSKVVKGETMAIAFDFDIEKSLYITADNSYLLLPVIETSIQNSIYAKMLGNNKFTFSSGTTSSRIKVGTNENGDVAENYSIDPLTDIEFIGNVIKLRPYYLTEEKLATSAARAIEIAIGGKYLDSVISIKLLENEIWQIYGVKNSSNITIKLDAKTGKVIGS
ncbi:MAG: DUF4382 domain-containing protein [Patescibacteria group bacterium]